MFLPRFGILIMNPLPLLKFSTYITNPPRFCPWGFPGNPPFFGPPFKGDELLQHSLTAHREARYLAPGAILPGCGHPARCGGGAFDARANCAALRATVAGAWGRFGGGWEPRDVVKVSKASEMEWKLHKLPGC